ncbi:hypothetical protein ACHAPG_010804 [Botrytis cinerea]
MLPLSDSEEIDMTSRPGQGRQERASKACEECRRRKLRCDGREPQCGVCRDAGATCEFNAGRALRGPKKGYFKELKDRIVTLERQLSLQQQTIKGYGLPNSILDHQEGPAFSGVVSPKSTSESEQQRAGSTLEDFSVSTSVPDRLEGPAFSGVVSPCSLTVGSEHCIGQRKSMSNSLNGISSVLKLSVNTNNTIPVWMHDELDQLYFDRVHKFIPLLHQRQYLSWSRKKTEKTSRLCLQSAMWTLATSVSVQFQHLQKQLFRDTKLMLESLSTANEDHSTTDTEHVQTLVLVAIYESMRAPKQQAWITAGQAFRLVQLMKFHEIDCPSVYATTRPTKSFLETEEQRRVFWMSYFLDTLLTMLNCLPLTMNEHVVFIRLPAPEEEFQCSQNVLGKFLSEAIVEQSPQTQSSFIQCVIFASICGRSLFYGQQFNLSMFYGGAPLDYSIQFQWLDDMVTTRLQILSQYNPSPTETHDPMLLFTRIIGQTAVMALCKGMELKLAADSDGGASVVAYQLRALTAAAQIVKLAKALTEFPIFKASLGHFFYSTRLLIFVQDPPTDAGHTRLLHWAYLRASIIPRVLQFPPPRTFRRSSQIEERQQPKSELCRLVRAVGDRWDTGSILVCRLAFVLFCRLGPIKFQYGKRPENNTILIHYNINESPEFRHRTVILGSM